MATMTYTLIAIDLRLHSVGRVPVEALNPKLLLDPLEEQFDFPAQAVQLGHGERGQREVIGEQGQRPVSIGVAVANPPQVIRIITQGFHAGEAYRLIADEAARFVHDARVQPLELQVLFSRGSRSWRGIV
jgi:hypothetical protein